MAVWEFLPSSLLQRMQKFSHWSKTDWFYPLSLSVLKFSLWRGYYKPLNEILTYKKLWCYNSLSLQLLPYRQRVPHAAASALECTHRDKDLTSASASEVRDLVAAVPEGDEFKQKTSTLNTSSSLLHHTSVTAAYDTAAQRGSVSSLTPLQDFYFIT